MNLERIVQQFGVTALIMISVAAVSVVTFMSDSIKRTLILNPYRVTAARCAVCSPRDGSTRT